MLCLFPAGSRCCSVLSCECMDMSVSTESKDEPQRAAPPLHGRHQACTCSCVIGKAGAGRQGHVPAEGEDDAQPSCPVLTLLELKSKDTIKRFLLTSDENGFSRLTAASKPEFHPVIPD